ncbi:deoxynucleoside monophosphate kinase [Hokovirus HKV1]|uniref:Deoxynucleoside monophosphate kinase n=1 Tax=Hokovirus HKV1 TaxID=1977638 RepID=A0A1V0SHA0_9VIRU|nr:deoxynucleoside monophosphate kinase [Hokovirus HKV1]
MNNNLLIGVAGHYGSGKTTVSEYICKNYDFTRLNFAEPVKEICKTIFNFNDQQLYGNLKNQIDTKWNITPRQAMQFIGTEFGRQFINNLIPIQDNLWVTNLENKIDKKTDINIIIDDCRLQNEIEMIKKKNGIIIKIERDGYIGDSHVSESYIDSIKGDYLIKNNSTLENLYSQIDTIIKYLNKN